MAVSSKDIQDIVIEPDERAFYDAAFVAGLAKIEAQTTATLADQADCFARCAVLERRATFAQKAAG